jgi:hypothetical protein
MKPIINILAVTMMGAIVLGEFQPSSTSAVSLIGGVIKARHTITEDVKYPRKDCPVCEGKGWYISGDNISKVDCGYCEEKSKIMIEPETMYPPIDVDNPEEIEPTDQDYVDDPPLVPVYPKQFILRN